MSSHNFTAVRLLPLTIRRLSGATFNVEISEDDTVFELKKMIQEVAGIPVQGQSLQIRGKVREEHLSLKKHGLVGGETVILCEDFILECTYTLQRLVLTFPPCRHKIGATFSQRLRRGIRDLFGGS
jgi:Ubiquitin family